MHYKDYMTNNSRKSTGETQKTWLEHRVFVVMVLIFRDLFYFKCEITF